MRPFLHDRLERLEHLLARSTTVLLVSAQRLRTEHVRIRSALDEGATN